jgi:hypothetical protein
MSSLNTSLKEVGPEMAVLVEKRVRTHLLAFNAAAVLAVALVYALFESPSATLEVGGVLMFVTYMALGVNECRRAPLILSPLSFWFWWISVDLGLAAFYEGSVMRQHQILAFVGMPINYQDVAAGYLIYLVGLLAMHMGVELLRPAEQEPETCRAGDGLNAGLRQFLLMWSVGLFSLLGGKVVAYLGGFSDLLGLCCITAVTAIAITPPQALGISKGSARWLLLFGTAGLFVGNLSSGSKAYIMFSFVPIFWLLLLDSRLRRWLPVAALAGTVFFLYVVLPVVTVARLGPNMHGQSLEAMHEDARTQIVETAQRMWSDRQAVESLAGLGAPDFFDAFLRRSFEPFACAFLVAEVRYRGFQDGSRLPDFLYALVPRILWPDKPMITPLWFLVYLHQAKTAETATNAIGPSFIGDLYWNFGVVGVIFGSLLAGLLIGKLWAMAGSDPRGRPLHLLLYLAVMLNMPKGSDITTKFLSIFFDLIVFKAFFWGAGTLGGLAALSSPSGSYLLATENSTVRSKQAANS